MATVCEDPDMHVMVRCPSSHNLQNFETFLSTDFSAASMISMMASHFHCASDAQPVVGLSEGVCYKPSTVYFNGHALSTPIPAVGPENQVCIFYRHCHKASLAKEKNSLRQHGEVLRGTRLHWEPVLFPVTQDNGIINDYTIKL